MTALRQLSFVYVVAAGGYSIAMMMSAHPVWTREAEDTAAYLKVEGYRSAENLNTNVVRPGVILAEGTGRAIGQSIEDSVFSHSRTSHPSPVRIAQAPRWRQRGKGDHCYAGRSHTARSRRNPGGQAWQQHGYADRGLR